MILSFTIPELRLAIANMRGAYSDSHPCAETIVTEAAQAWLEEHGDGVVVDTLGTETDA